MKRLEVKKGHAGLYLFLLVLVIALMFFLKQCSVPVVVESDSRAGGDTLNVAIELSPTGVFSRGDSIAGFNYDMIRSVASVAGRPLKISSFTSPQSALRGLDAGRYDIVLADLPVTVGMKENYIFTIPVYVDHQTLVRRRKTGNDNFIQTDLAGDTVWIAAGSPYYDRLRNFSHEIGDTIYIVEDPEYGAEQLVILTALGEIKQAVVNEETARKVAVDYDNLDISTSISFNQFQSWILSPRDSVLRDSLNVWIDRVKNSELFKEINNKYF